jgi:hypothetical protein
VAETSPEGLSATRRLTANGLFSIPIRESYLCQDSDSDHDFDIRYLIWRLALD